MRFTGYRFCQLLTVLAVCVGATRLPAQAVVNAVNTFDTLVRNYNLISFGNATFTQYGDTEGPLAVKGNLYLDGGAVAAQPGKYGSTSDPTLYVGGTLTMSNYVQLQNGYASIKGSGNSSYTWDGVQDRLTGGGGVLSTINSSDPKADVDPRTNPIPSGWNWSTIQTALQNASTDLKNASANAVNGVGSGYVMGTIGISGQTLQFLTPNGYTSGVVVFDFDANLLSGNTYNGQMFSNVQFTVPSNINYVINVLNAAGRTIFGTGSGINFNSGSGYERLLWNIVSTPGNTADVNLGNGGQFYGSILAPTVNLNNAGNTAVNGQVVALSYDHSGAELHFTGFQSVQSSVVPEPSTYGAILVGAGALGVGFFGYRRRQKRAA